MMKTEYDFTLNCPWCGVGTEYSLSEHFKDKDYLIAQDLYEALERVLAIADRKTDEFDAARAALAKAKPMMATGSKLRRKNNEIPRQGNRYR